MNKILSLYLRFGIFQSFYSGFWLQRGNPDIAATWVVTYAIVSLRSIPYSWFDFIMWLISWFSGYSGWFLIKEREKMLIVQTNRQWENIMSKYSQKLFLHNSYDDISHESAYSFRSCCVGLYFPCRHRSDLWYIHTSVLDETSILVNVHIIRISLGLHIPKYFLLTSVGTAEPVNRI